ncbi:BF3164 family lipoprotein [Flavobacterium sp. RS13.1]|uniref:BF3164 family lipoprotein n=1 Tax=Flavobacterium sp. RS13.1 TaxID=3400345 RepID=UPI003AAFDB56
MKIINNNRTNIYAFLSIIILCLTSCQTINKAENINLKTFEKFQQEGSPSFTNLFEFTNGVPNIIHSIDTTLIISLGKGGINDAFFYNYSLPNKTLSKGYLKGGRGPEEALTVFSSGIIGNILWSYDITLGRITTIDKEKALKQEKNINIKQYSKNVFSYQIAFKDLNTILAVGNRQSKYKIQEIDLKSEKIIAEYGEFDNISEAISFESFKSANECFILTKPSGKKAVISYRYKDEIEIFNTESHKSIAIIKGPEAFEADLDLSANVAYRNKNTRFAFFNGDTTEKFIYLLYSGNSHESEFRDFCNTVYVYDWEGNPVRKIKLNKYVTSLSVAKDDSALYAYDPYSGQIVQAQIQF